MRALAALIMLAACSVSEAPAQVEGPAQAAQPAAPGEVSQPPAPTSLTLDCAGAFTQGGVAVCRTLPGAQITIDGADVGGADRDGWALIGFNRQHGGTARVVANVQGAEVVQTFAIVPREFDIQRIDGLPPQTVTPTDPAVLERIRRESAMKAEGFASEADITSFLDGFIWPVEGGRISGRWGGQRILNGVPNTPHFGVDIAVPVGTPIRAPAGGIVSFANADMHYEGGLVFIDHGHGLITMYLHMSRLDVQAGQRVEQGQIIGAVGATGRATGPHLCWRMRWRERQLDPTVAIDGLGAAREQLVSR